MILAGRELIHVDKEMILEHYVPLGLPIPFKEWKVYPITVRDSIHWKQNFNILTVEKNNINSIEVIQMSYLKFLVMTGIEDSTIFERLFTLLSLCLDLKHYNLDIELVDGGQDVKLSIAPYIEVGEGKILPDFSQVRYINSQEFDELKTIILYQNIFDYDDSYIDPDVKKAIDEYYALLNRHSPDVSLERRIAVVSASTGMTLEQILGMTFRAFNLLFDTIVDKVDYTILKHAECLPDVKFKKPVEHWVYKEPRNKYKDAFVDYDQVASKINSSNI